MRKKVQGPPGPARPRTAEDEALDDELVEAMMDRRITVKLSRDMQEAAERMQPREVRYYVRNYYVMQKQRIRSKHQEAYLLKSGHPHELITWFKKNSASLEGTVKAVLDRYSGSKPLGRWCRSIPGIGPVISSGLMANIDIEKATTAGDIWRFAGLDPTDKWLPATERPWNGPLKRLCFLIGECFVKVSGKDDDIYGQVYLQRKAYEAAKNEALEYADQAAAGAARVGADTEAIKSYRVGKLPLGHLHTRAKRYAVKLFLAHYHHVAWTLHFGTEPPKPYILTKEGHTHFQAPPNLDQAT